MPGMVLFKQMLNRSKDRGAAEAELCDQPGADRTRVRRIRSALPDESVFQRLAETFRALGDPTRARILFALTLGEQCVCDLAGALAASESLVSHHLRWLRAMDLVRARRDGRRVFYALDDAHITQLFEGGLEHVLERRRR
jgi:ArsR family transcriptional regulator